MEYAHAFKTGGGRRLASTICSLMQQKTRVERSC